MQKVGTVLIDLPSGACLDHALTAHFSFGEAQLGVRVVDEQTGQERHTRIVYDSRELTEEDILKYGAAAG
jgi:hypothetical protein